ncbi:MAG: T9SS type A sorting domain-containing protein [Flavobacteriales bacterium]
MATNSFGIDSLTKTSTIYIVPTAGAVTTIGATLTIASTGVLYKWVNCDSNYSFHPKDTNQSFTPIINGNYACIITTPEGCLDTTACFSINSVKLENVSKDAFEVKVYPNPVNEILTVEVLKQEIKGDISITIIDEIGRLVYFKKEMPTDENIKIPVNSFESGSYTLVLNSKSFSVRKKIIIVR